MRRASLKQYPEIFLILLLSVNIGLVACVKVEEKESKDSPQIYRFENEEHNVMTKSWNKTYIFDAKLIQNQNITNVYFELQIETQLNAQNSIIFGFKKNRALYYSSSSDTFNAEYIDSRGYYMRKQYYRIQLQPDETQQSDHFYITIFQNILHPQELQYSLRMIVENQTDAEHPAHKPCPFNCLSRGQCNSQEGTCFCTNSFVDYDCSKPSTSLSGINQSSSSSSQSSLSSNQPSSSPNQSPTLEWNIEFENHTNGQFFHILDRSFEGYLYLQIDLSDEIKSMYKEKTLEQELNILSVYYTLETKNLRGIGVADNNFAQLTQHIDVEKLISKSEGVEIFIDQFHSNSQTDNLNIEFIQRMLLFGFRLKDNVSKLEFNLKLVLKDEATHNQNKGFFNYLQHNQTIILLFVILFVLIVILGAMLFYLKKSSILISQTQQLHQIQLKNKKLQKEEEFRKIFDLIPSILFCEETKNKYWSSHLTNQQNQEQEQPCCSICLCEFDEGDEIRMTYCPHYFHADCLSEWLKKQKNCPHCRNELTLAILQTLKKPIKSSPSFFKTIFGSKNNSPSIEKKKQINGYVQQQDEVIIHFEPLALDLQQKQEQQQNTQTVDVQKIKEIKFQSSENVLKKATIQQKKRKLMKQNSMKWNSLTELDEVEGSFQQTNETSFRMKSQKLLKLDSMDVENKSPICIKQFALTKKSIFNQ